MMSDDTTFLSRHIHEPDHVSDSTIATVRQQVGHRLGRRRQMMIGGAGTLLLIVVIGAGFALITNETPTEVVAGPGEPKSSPADSSPNPPVRIQGVECGNLPSDAADLGLHLSVSKKIDAPALRWENPPAPVSILLENRTGSTIKISFSYSIPLVILDKQGRIQSMGRPLAVASSRTLEPYQTQHYNASLPVKNCEQSGMDRLARAPTP